MLAHFLMFFGNRKVNEFVFNSQYFKFSGLLDCNKVILANGLM